MGEMKDTLTLVLNGHVSLREFSTAISEFLTLVNGLGVDVAQNVHIEWFIDNLEAGSATATVRGIVEEGNDKSVVARVVDAYLEVGRAVRERRPLNYSQPVKLATKRLMTLINGGIRSVRFETADDDVELFARPGIVEKLGVMETMTPNLGAVQGRVQSMTSRGVLRFTLYDLIDDRAISCYLAPGSEDIMREAWGKIAVVEGFVRRDPETGQPTTVRGVRHIQIVSEGKPGDYRQAIGAAPNFSSCPYVLERSTTGRVIHS